jgi:hypothetical protein
LAQAKANLADVSTAITIFEGVNEGTPPQLSVFAVRQFVILNPAHQPRRDHHIRQRVVLKSP